MQQNTQPKENKMGTMPIPRLLISMSLPMMISMLVQAMYNIVDSIFVSRVDEYALTAVSLAFPIQNLMIAVASGTGVGINALLSRSLGEKNPKEASRAANNGVFLAILSYLVFMLIGIFVSKPFFASQTDNEMIVQYGIEYMSIICICSFGIFMQMTFERLLQATGRTLYSMITQTIGALVNIVMDPILIFGLFGFPKMGVAGAAAATVGGQILAAILAIYFNLRVNKEISFRFKGFRPNGRVIRTIYMVGVPSIIMMAIGSVMTFGFNKILLQFTTTATAVFGVYFKLNSFAFMPIFGMNNGLIPIIAYNYGARNRDRILQTVKLGVAVAVSIMAVGLAVFQIFPDKLLMLFKASENMLQIGIPALRIISLSFLLAGYCIIIGSVFQALGNSFYSLLVSLARQLIVLLPAAYILSKIGGLDAVWWSYNIAEIVSVILTTVFLRKIYKEKLANLS